MGSAPPAVERTTPVRRRTTRMADEARSAAASQRTDARKLEDNVFLADFNGRENLRDEFEEIFHFLVRTMDVVGILDLDV